MSRIKWQDFACHETRSDFGRWQAGNFGVVCGLTAFSQKGGITDSHFGGFGSKDWVDRSMTIVSHFAHPT